MLRKIGIAEERKERARNYGFILYEDSASVVWKDTLEDLHVKGYWIKHDKDTDMRGNLKKEHYHVMLNFPHAIRARSVEELLSRVGVANGFYETVQSVPGYARYMCHLDNPEKYQYLPSDVHELGGAKYDEIIKIQSKKDKSETLKEIIQFCEDNELECYATLVKYAMDNNDRWLDLLMNIRFGKLIQDYIKSSAWARR